MDERTEKTLRCDWVSNDPLYIEYHDKEWGVPCYNDHKLFTFLLLEGAKAGLNWITILRKRSNYEKAFDFFIPEKIADFNENKILSLMANPGIVRNRRKIESAVNNARGYLDIVRARGSFSDYIWQFVDHRPIINQWKTSEDVPTQTSESVAMSKDLKKRGFSFVGPTICYAYMQAMGMVNDHLLSCFRHSELCP